MSEIGAVIVEALGQIEQVRYMIDERFVKTSCDCGSITRPQWVSTTVEKLSKAIELLRDARDVEASK